MTEQGWHLTAASPGGQGDMVVTCDHPDCDWGELVPYVRGMEPGGARREAERLGRLHELSHD